MALTILAIPLIIFGAFIKPYAVDATRCFAVSFLAKDPFCFEAASSMPEVIKYGSLLLGFAMIYAGRQQIRRRREGK